MARLNNRALIVGTACAVLGIGYVMQYGLGLPSSTERQTPSVATGSLGQLAVRDIVDTSSATVLPLSDVTPPETIVPVAREAETALPTEPVKAAVVQDGDLVLPETLPNDITETPALACDVSITAALAPAAQVDLSVFAPCLKNERLTLHHNGLMITASTDDAGRLSTTIPAMSEKAVFIVSFGNGEGAVSQIEVPALQAYDRVALQWKGNTGLELHAREFGADYYETGHIWRDAQGSVQLAQAGAGGFLTLLGDRDAPDSLMAQVYTFPSSTSVRGGMVDLSIEAEITADNCGTEIEAQAIQLGETGAVKVSDVFLNVPECDAVGGFLLVDTLLQDVVVARR